MTCGESHTWCSECSVLSDSHHQVRSRVLPWSRMNPKLTTRFGPNRGHAATCSRISFRETRTTSHSTWQAMPSAVVTSEVSADPAESKMRISSVVSGLGAHKIARLRKALKSMAESTFHGSWHTTFKHTPFVHGSERH